MVVKDTSFFQINKCKGPHTYVNPCLNREHQQLEFNLIVAHIKAMIKVPFTFSVIAIQASIMEKFGYEISIRRHWLENIKLLLTCLVTFISHMQSCHFSSWP